MASYLKPFLNTCSALITAYRSEQGRCTLETKMLESENRFRTLADSLPVEVWLADLDGKSTWFNRRWLAFTGRTLEEEIGHCWLQDVHPEDRERCKVKVICSAGRKCDRSRSIFTRTPSDGLAIVICWQLSLKKEQR